MSDDKDVDQQQLEESLTSLLRGFNADVEIPNTESQSDNPDGKNTEDTGKLNDIVENALAMAFDSVNGEPNNIIEASQEENVITLQNLLGESTTASEPAASSAENVVSDMGNNTSPVSDSHEESNGNDGDDDFETNQGLLEQLAAAIRDTENENNEHYQDLNSDHEGKDDNAALEAALTGILAQHSEELGAAFAPDAEQDDSRGNRSATSTVFLDSAEELERHKKQLADSNNDTGLSIAETLALARRNKEKQQQQAREEDGLDVIDPMVSNRPRSSESLTPGSDMPAAADSKKKRPYKKSANRKPRKNGKESSLGNEEDEDPDVAAALVLAKKVMEAQDTAEEAADEADIEFSAEAMDALQAALRALGKNDLQDIDQEVDEEQGDLEGLSADERKKSKSKQQLKQRRQLKQTKHKEQEILDSQVDTELQRISAALQEEQLQQDKEDALEKRLRENFEGVSSSDDRSVKRPRRERVGTPRGPRRQRPDEISEEEREKRRISDRERKKRWRGENSVRNRDNDLRARIYKRALTIYGPNESREKTEWIESEFVRRKQKRLARANLTKIMSNGDEASSAFISELKSALGTIARSNPEDGSLHGAISTLLQDSSLLNVLSTDMSMSENEQPIDNLVSSFRLDPNTSGQFSDSSLSSLSIPGIQRLASGVPDRQLTSLISSARAIVEQNSARRNRDDDFDGVESSRYWTDPRMLPPALKPPKYLGTTSIVKPNIVKIPLMMSTMGDDDERVLAFGFPPLVSVQR